LASATKERQYGFRDAVGDTYGRAKQGVKNTYGKAKQGVKNYATTLEEAYLAGYDCGWQARDNVPTTPGARQSATIGFDRGLRDHGRKQKVEARYDRAQNRKKYR
jgi:hypothetical protein